MFLDEACSDGDDDSGTTLLDGETIEYDNLGRFNFVYIYNQGTIISKTKYTNGEKIRKEDFEVFYYLRDETECLKFPDGNVLKSKILYSENGEILEEYKYNSGGILFFIRKNGKFWNDNYKEYYSNGIIKLSANYKAGYVDGLYTEYFSDGKIFRKINYFNGIKNGYENIFWNKNYPNDVTDSDKSFYAIGLQETGFIFPFVAHENYSVEINWKNGVKQGNQKLYKNGKIIIEATYINGNIEGIKKVYNKEEKVIANIQYKNGEIINFEEFEKIKIFDNGEMEKQ